MESLNSFWAGHLGSRAVEFLASQPASAAHALHLLGDIAIQHDQINSESGEIHYRKALALAEPRGMRPLVAHCHFSLGKLYRQMSKKKEAEEYYTTAAAMYREMEMGFWEKRTELEIVTPT